MRTKPNSGTYVRIGEICMVFSLKMDIGFQQKASLFSFILALLGSIGLSFVMVHSFLLPVIMGSILALVIWPIQKKMSAIFPYPRMLAAALSFIGILLIIAPIMVFSVLAIRQAVSIFDYLVSLEVLEFDRVMNFLGSLNFDWVFKDLDLDTYIEDILNSLANSASVVVLGVAKSLPQGGLALVLVVVSCYFMLIDGANFLVWIYARIPLSMDVRQRLTIAFHRTAISVIWASMAAALTQAVIMFVSFLLLGIPAAFLAFGLTFIFAFVPLAGSLPIWLSGAVYLFLKQRFIELALMLSIGVFTSLIDNLVRPWVLKGRSEIHPLVSIISIFGGITMFGVFGVFLGPILSAVMISLLQIWPVIGKRYGLEFNTGFESIDEFHSELNTEHTIHLPKVEND
jgi:predicted PurR-regulated permease PerM